TPLWRGLRTVPPTRCGTVSGPCHFDRPEARCGTVSGPCHFDRPAPLWHGLRTVPLRPTGGLPAIHPPRLPSERPAVSRVARSGDRATTGTCGQPGGTVR